MCEDNFNEWLEVLKNCSEEEVYELLENEGWLGATKAVLHKTYPTLSSDEAKRMVDQSVEALLNKRVNFTYRPEDPED